MSLQFIEKESDAILQVNNTVLTERQYFVFNGSHCYRRKVYIMDNKVVAWAAIYSGKDPELHMSISLTDNPRNKQLVEFLLRRCGIAREQLVQVYNL